MGGGREGKSCDPYMSSSAMRYHLRILAKVAAIERFRFEPTGSAALPLFREDLRYKVKVVHCKHTSSGE